MVTISDAHFSVMITTKGGGGYYGNNDGGYYDNNSGDFEGNNDGWLL